MLGSQTLTGDEVKSREATSAEISLQPYPVSIHYLAKLFSWIGIWAFLITSFIWLLDPYGVSPFKIKLDGINLYKPQRLDIDRLIKPFEVWRYQPKTIFIGTSRIHQSLDPSALDGTSFAPAYNAAIPASTLMENADHIEQFLKLDHNIKHLFVELFLYNFTSQIPNASPKSWSQFLSNIVSLEFSTDAFLNAIKTLYTNRLIKQGKEPTPATIAAGGYRIPKGDFNPADTFNDSLFMRTVIAWNKASQLTLQEEAFKPLDRIVKIAHEHGIELHLIIAPNYPWDDYRLMTLGYWPLLEKWLRKLSSYPGVVSFSQYNELLEEVPTHEPKMKWWNDPIHVSLNMGRAMLKSYSGKPDKETPKNLRRDLNPQTVESIIAERRSGLLHWVAKHPDFVMNFEDAKLAPDSISGNLNLVEKALTLNGEKHPIALGEGEVAFTKASNASLNASGWAVDEMGKRPPRLLVATIGNSVVAQGYASVKRPDLAAGFNNKELTSGFSIEIPLKQPTSSEPIRVFALMHDGRAVQLVSEAKLIDGKLAAGPLGVVKAHQLVIGKKIYPVADYFAGSVDKISITPSGQSYRVDGWAVDAKAKDSVLAIIAATGSDIVAKSIPTIMRQDLAQNKLLNSRPIGFSMLVPLDAKRLHEKETIQLFALVSGGHAVPLKKSEQL